MTQAHGKRRVKVAPGVLSREVHGEAVLLHLDSGEYFGLDEVATRMWQLIEAHGDLDAVAAAIRDEYDVDLDAASRDLDELVGQLLEKRLLEAVAPESGG